MRAEAANQKLSRVQGAALVVGVLGLAATVGGYFFLAGKNHPNQFYGAYLVGWLMWTGMSLGCLGVLMLHHMSGGNWGYVTRRFWEAGAMLIPVMGLFFIPIAMNLTSGHGIYEWSHPDQANNAFVHAKAPYLNIEFFLLRVIAIFGVFTLMAVLLNKLSADIDRTSDIRIVSKFKIISGPGLVIYFLLMTLFGVDTIMSLEVEWYSSIFGLLLVISLALSAFSLVAFFLHMLRNDDPFKPVMIPKRFHEHGTLMLALTLLFAYMAFSQYLISWAGNLPEEANWYLHRIEGGWGIFAWAIVILHFAVPYVLLMQRPLKKKSASLAAISGLLLVMRWIDYAWLVLPTPIFEVSKLKDAGAVIGVSVAATLGLGGIWLFLFVLRLKSRPLLPLYMSHLEHPQPFEAEVLNHG
jgi:hypothetical protein